MSPKTPFLPEGDLPEAFAESNPIPDIPGLTSGDTEEQMRSVPAGGRVATPAQAAAPNTTRLETTGAALTDAPASNKEWVNVKSTYWSTGCSHTAEISQDEWQFLVERRARLAAGGSTDSKSSQTPETINRAVDGAVANTPLATYTNIEHLRPYCPMINGTIQSNQDDITAIFEERNFGVEEADLTAFWKKELVWHRGRMAVDWMMVLERMKDILRAAMVCRKCGQSPGGAHVVPASINDDLEEILDLDVAGINLDVDRPVAEFVEKMTPRLHRIEKIYRQESLSMPCTASLW